MRQSKRRLASREKRSSRSLVIRSRPAFWISKKKLLWSIVLRPMRQPPAHQGRSALLTRRLPAAGLNACRRDVLHRLRSSGVEWRFVNSFASTNETLRQYALCFDWRSMTTAVPNGSRGSRRGEASIERLSRSPTRRRGPPGPCSRERRIMWPHDRSAAALI